MCCFNCEIDQQLIKHRHINNVQIHIERIPCRSVINMVPEKKTQDERTFTLELDFFEQEWGEVLRELSKK